MSSCTHLDRTSFTEEQQKLIGLDPLAGAMRVYKIGDPADSLLIRKKSLPLTSEDIRSVTYHVLKQRMLSTVTSVEERGVGIAAPQVGVLKRLVAVQRVDKEGEPFAFYPNAEILEYRGDTVVGMEGCLSIPGESGYVPRATEITVAYTDEKTGDTVTESVEGYAAVIFQYEIDHLEGILYIDRMIDPELLRPEEDICQDGVNVDE